MNPVQFILTILANNISFAGIVNCTILSFSKMSVKLWIQVVLITAALLNFSPAAFTDGCVYIYSR